MSNVIDPRYIQPCQLPEKNPFKKCVTKMSKNIVGLGNHDAPWFTGMIISKHHILTTWYDVQDTCISIAELGDFYIWFNWEFDDEGLLENHSTYKLNNSNFHFVETNKKLNYAIIEIKKEMVFTPFKISKETEETVLIHHAANSYKCVSLGYNFSHFTNRSSGGIYFDQKGNCVAMEIYKDRQVHFWKILQESPVLNILLYDPDCKFRKLDVLSDKFGEEEIMYFVESYKQSFKK